MERATPVKRKRFPATHRADVVFGATSGAILGLTASLASVQLNELTSNVLPIAIISVFVGAIVSGIAGAIHHWNRTTFDSSELGVRLGIAFALIPSLMLFTGALGFAEGRASVRFVVAIGFAAVMAGLILGSILDRIYDTILKRRSNNRS